MAFEFHLKRVLEELEWTRNALAVEAKTRTATVYDLYDGNTKRVELVTIEKILHALNTYARDRGSNKKYTIDSLIEYKPEE